MENKPQFKIPTDVKPLHADEVNINSNIKVNIDKKEDGTEKITKVGRVDLLFFDQMTKSILTRVVIDPYTAKMLAKMLLSNADKLIEEIEKTDLPDEVRQKLQEKGTAQKEVQTTYIG